MIGHQEAEKAFLEAWQGGRVHHAWLLAGPQGMGKGAFAERVARFLVTHGRGGECHRQADDCHYEWQSPALERPGDELPIATEQRVRQTALATLH